MANKTERAILQAMIHPAATPLSEQPLFSDFTSDDAILAAFVDGTLEPAQHNAVQAALASSGRLRHIWRGMREANHAAGESTSAGSTGKKHRAPLWGGLGLVASLVLVVLVQTQQAQRDSQPATALAMEAEQIPAPTLASRAVPVAAWHAFIAAYDNPQQTMAEQGDATQLAFTRLAGQARALENGECSDAQLAPLRESFIALSQQYPEELGPLIPAKSTDWCHLGKVLRQTAAMAVSTHNH